MDPVVALTEAGAALDARDCDGDTAVFLAALHGHIHVLYALLRQGAEPNTPRPSSGVTPLLAAAQRGAGVRWGGRALCGQ